MSPCPPTAQSSCWHGWAAGWHVSPGLSPALGTGAVLQSQAGTAWAHPPGLGVRRGLHTWRARCCPILKGWGQRGSDCSAVAPGWCTALWEERGTPKPWGWGEALFPGCFLGQPSHRTELSASPGSLCTSGVEQLGWAGSVQHWHPGEAQQELPFLI